MAGTSLARTWGSDALSPLIAGRGSWVCGRPNPHPWVTPKTCLCTGRELSAAVAGRDGPLLQTETKSWFCIVLSLPRRAPRAIPGVPGAEAGRAGHAAVPPVRLCDAQECWSVAGEGVAGAGEFLSPRVCPPKASPGTYTFPTASLCSALTCCRLTACSPSPLLVPLFPVYLRGCLRPVPLDHHQLLQQYSGLLDSLQSSRPPPAQQEPQPPLGLRQVSS